MDNPLEHALDRELAAFLQDEYAAQGEELYQWYRHYYVPRNMGLAPYNIAIADFVTEHCRSPRFIEIGAGIGQISMLLATRRQQTWAIEGHSTEIHPMAERAFARIKEKVFPELPKYMTLMYDWFPNSAAKYVTSDSVLCFPTLSGGSAMTPEYHVKILDVMSTAAAVILSLRDFFRVRETKEERDALIEQIRARGFDPPIVVLDWDSYSPDTTVFMKKSAKIRRSLFSRLGISK